MNIYLQLLGKRQTQILISRSTHQSSNLLLQIAFNNGIMPATTLLPRKPRQTYPTQHQQEPNETQMVCGTLQNQSFYTISVSVPPEVRHLRGMEMHFLIIQTCSTSNSEITALHAVKNYILILTGMWPPRC